MEYVNSDELVAISIRDHKHTALFFDKIIPVHSYDSIPTEVTFFDQSNHALNPDFITLLQANEEEQQDGVEEVFVRMQELISGQAFNNNDEVVSLFTTYFPDDKRISRRKRKQFADNIAMTAERLRHSLSGSYDFHLDESAISEAFTAVPKDSKDIISAMFFLINESLKKDNDIYRDIIQLILAISAQEQLKSKNLKSTLALSTKEIFSKLKSDYIKLLSEEMLCDTLVLTISGLSLIDTSELEWDQIIQLRADDSAKMKLRRLRLFFYDHYKDKNQSYIEDHLLKALDDYEAACQKHGFKLKESSLSLLFNSKSLQATVAATSFGIILGEPLLASAVTAAGVSLETGKISLNIAKEKVHLNDFKENHELAYIFEVKSIDT